MKNNDVEDLLQYHSPYLRKRTARFVTNEVLKGRFACAHLFDQLVSADSEQPVPLEPLDQVVLEKKIRAWLDRPVLPALWQRSIGQYSPIEGEDNLDDKSDFGNGTEGEPRLRPLYQGMMQLLSEPGTYSSKLAQAPSDRASLRKHVGLWCSGEESKVKAFFYRRSMQHFWDMCLKLAPSDRNKTFAENEIRLLKAIRTIEARQEHFQSNRDGSSLSNSELANDLAEMIWSGELKLKLKIQKEVNRLLPSYQAGALSRGEEESMTDRLVTILLKYLHMMDPVDREAEQEEQEDANLAQIALYQLMERMVGSLSEDEQKIANYILQKVNPNRSFDYYEDDEAFYLANGLTKGQMDYRKPKVREKLEKQISVLDPDLYREGMILKKLATQVRALDSDLMSQQEK